MPSCDTQVEDSATQSLISYTPIKVFLEKHVICKNENGSVQEYGKGCIMDGNKIEDLENY